MTDPRRLLAGLDVGTTSVRTVLFDLRGRAVASASFRQRTSTPHPGWVEQDPDELYRLACRSLRKARQASDARGRPLAAIGVTNQRESVVAMDGELSQPLGPAIIWQDNRTAELARELGAGGWAARVWDRTGLPLGTYPSAPKMLWLLRHRPEVARAARRGSLRLGTVDTWVLHRLLSSRPGNGPWLTDATNASRTVLFDLERGDWSRPLLRHFQLDREFLAEVRPTFGAPLGEVIDPASGARGTPVGACVGDQQAGLFGLSGGRPGAAKLTFGTGAFFLAEGAPRGTGRPQGLIRTLLWEELDGRRGYGLEGGVEAAGGLLDWLGPHGLGLFSSAHELERLAARQHSEGEEVFVPALGGLFAPHWDPEARGALFGLSRATTRANVAHAALEGIAHRVADVLEAYAKAVGHLPEPVWVDGGLSVSRHLVQRVADLSGGMMRLSPEVEATSRGAALAAGISVGVFRGPSSLPEVLARPEAWVRPRCSESERLRQRERWRSFLARAAGPSTHRE